MTDQEIIEGLQMDFTRMNREIVYLMQERDDLRHENRVLRQQIEGAENIGKLQNDLVTARNALEQAKREIKGLLALKKIADRKYKNLKLKCDYQEAMAGKGAKTLPAHIKERGISCRQLMRAMDIGYAVARNLCKVEGFNVRIKTAVKVCQVLGLTMNQVEWVVDDDED